MLMWTLILARSLCTEILIHYRRMTEQIIINQVELPFKVQILFANIVLSWLADRGG